MIPKPKRIKNKKLLDHIRHNGYNRCQICGTIPSQTHHIKSKGSGGYDISENIVRLCTKCHIKAHAGKYPDSTFIWLAYDRIREEEE